MTTVAYYPGCSLKRSGRICETAGLAAAERLGLELVELERWNCCGTVFSMSSGDRMHHLGSLRNLVRVQQVGHDEVVTMCAMCHNTLRQVNDLARDDDDALSTLNQFMDEEPDYRGDVEVLHYLTMLDRLGPEAIAERWSVPSRACAWRPTTAARSCGPKGAGVDDPEDPSLMERLLELLGAEVVRDPMRVECCGAYMSVSSTGDDRVRAAGDPRIGACERRRGAGHDVPAVRPQPRRRSPGPDEPGLVVFYFTQLVALALGAPPEEFLDASQRVDPASAAAREGAARGVGAMTNRVGVFICHCGKNIARTVDVDSAARRGRSPARRRMGPKTTCTSAPTPARSSSVTASPSRAWTPWWWRPARRRSTPRPSAAPVESAGRQSLLPRDRQHREQCSWVHPMRKRPRARRTALVRSGVEKARRAQPLEPIRAGLQRAAVVIGGGVAGIQAALDIADAGYPSTWSRRARP